MVDVLLISPRLPADDQRRCGDHAYTDLLLQHPPAGVSYFHYEDLIASGQLRRIAFLQAMGYYLTRLGILPPDLWGEYLDSDLLPDLIHIVAFAATIRLPSDRKVPVLAQTASPSVTDLTVKRNWEPGKVERHYRRKRWFLQAVGAYHYALNTDQIGRVLVQTDFGRKLLMEYGSVAASKVEVLYPAQPASSDTVVAPLQRSKKNMTFLFVGSDFERKNGHTVVEAFRRVHQTFPESRLILVGRPADGVSYDGDAGICHHGFVPHQQLLDEVFPQADAFILPTGAEGSFAFTLFEAMAAGLLVVTVDAWAMPEIVIHGETGFLLGSGSVDELSTRMEQLAGDADLVYQMRKASKARFVERFSVDTHNVKLQRVYRELLGETDPAGG